MAAAASLQVSLSIHDRECFDIADERSELETAAVNIGPKRTAKRQSIRPGLLLNYPSLPTLALLHSDEAFDQLGPLNAGIGFDDAPLVIEAKTPLHRACVDHHRPAGELLATHGMTAAGNRNRLSGAPGGSNCSPQR